MLSLILVLCCSLHASAAPVNLIANPSFDDGLAHWTVGFGAGAKADRDVFHSAPPSARLSVTHETAGIDSQQLIVGHDIYPEATYRISAWIKSGGIEKGNFGGRFYCYGPDNDVLTMHNFGVLEAPAPADEWRQATIQIGPDATRSIPPRTERIVVRFSIWAADGDCTGTVWVDDVELTQIHAGPHASPPEWLQRSDTGTALILKDALPASGTASAPDPIAEILASEGLAVNLVTADRFIQPGALNPRWTDLIVLPYGGTFPADARDAFVRYVRYGGSFINIGGLGFDSFVRRVNGRWADVSDIVTNPDDLAPIADFDQDVQPDWDLSHRSDSDTVRVECNEPGADDTPACARVTADLDAFAYAGLQKCAAPDAHHSVLCFRARGDAETRQLAVELRGGDGSRWKHVVPLNQDWRMYQIPNTHFLSYATEHRGEPGDFVRAENAAGVWFGFTRRMVGEGEHTFWLDGLHWRPLAADAGLPPAPIRPAKSADLTLAAFGANIRLPREDHGSVPVFSPLRRFENARQIKAVSIDGETETVARGTFTGWITDAPTLLPFQSSGSGLRTGGPRVGRLIPVLQACDAAGEPIGAVGAIYYPLRPTQRGAVWAFFGVSSADLLTIAERPMTAAIRRVAQLVAGAPAIEAVDTTFTPDDPSEAQVRVDLRGVPGRYPNCELSVRATSDRRVVYGRRVPLNRRDPMVLKLGHLPPTLLNYKVEAALFSDDEMLDRTALTVDARRCFLRLADWLVEIQSEDGTFSGVSFQDNRAARGLLGAYEITGDTRYRDAAIRWGEHMIDRQRDDGGYRMGYGISQKGEACYVADGGEIAIAMARLATYTDGDQRQRFVDSLEAYMGYRERFRQDSGAIGVGWCLRDYSKRPIVPLEEPTRIYAGEMNKYTIGCTLAAAAAYTRITGDPEDLAMARRDTEWLLDNYTSLSGAAVESAFWAHHYTADERLKARIEKHMRDSFRDRIIQQGNRDWLRGGGRSVLNLDAIAYWLNAIDPDDDAMRAAYGRWLYALCGSNSTSAAHLIMQAGELNNTEQRFLCFLAVALADAVQPMVSLKPF